MKQRAIMLALLVACVGGVARAQAPAESKYYAEITGGATFGHKAGGSIGAEGAYFVLPSIGIFAETGWMSNVVTSGVANDASFIAAATGLSASPKTRLTYFDVGVTYRIRTSSQRFHPYALLGIGVAHANNDTTFTAGGNDVTGQLLTNYGIQLGTDLAGSYNKVYTVIGAGVHVPVGKQYFGDVSYRYGYVPKETSDNADIAAINTNRLQFGFGIRF